MPTQSPSQQGMNASPPHKKPATLLVTGLVIGLVVGYGIGRTLSGSPINPIGTGTGSYQEGFDAAMENVVTSGFIPPSPEIATVIGGSVTEISGDHLTFQADLRAFDPLGIKKLPSERSVTVTAETRITRFTSLTPEELETARIAFEKAVENFQPDPEDLALPPTPPSTSTVTEISLSEIGVGERITVEAEDNILASPSFVALRITVLPDQEAETPPPIFDSPPPDDIPPPEDEPPLSPEL